MFNPFVVVRPLRIILIFNVGACDASPLKFMNGAKGMDGFAESGVAIDDERNVDAARDALGVLSHFAHGGQRFSEAGDSP